MAYDYTKDPFYQEYQRDMRRVRSARPAKNASLRVEVPKQRFTDKEIRRAMDARNAPARPDTGATISAPRRGGIERTADRLAAFGVPLSVTDAIKSVDRNLLGLDETAQSIRNIQSGDAGAGDYINVALSTPVGALAVKPIEAGARAAGRGAARLGRRALATRAGRYLTEARPLLDKADDAIEATFTVVPGAQRRITNRRPTVRGLPAPEKRAALPAPGPGLPEYAAKPRGGQWWPGNKGPYTLLNPEEAVRGNVYLTERTAPRNDTDRAFAEWFDKALPRYLQNDFATPDDPLRALADQGYIPGVANAMQWSGLAKKDVVPFPMQKLLFDPSAAKTRDEALADMPWLNKLPQTETVYGVWPREGTKDIYQHVRDEMRNALRADELGIPADLAVRPDSLARMSFPQAVERVGKINQWRAKQAEQAQLSAMDNPALAVFKEYPDDPRGMRWVELRAPDLDEGYTLDEATGEIMTPYGSNGPAGGAGDPRRPILEEALRYEGDVMGHCVGGYCPDVMSGRSRIFSLRDAKGEPHVTIETAPQRLGLSYEQMRAFKDQAEQEARGMDFDSDEAWEDFILDRSDQLKGQWVRDQGANAPQNIVQIKGKQNRAPKDDYLPFVQDFVKGGQWGEIGDFANTGLVKLPDGRYITTQQLNEAVASPGALKLLGSAENARSQLAPWNINTFSPEDWEQTKHLFEGYARGGPVQSLAAKPCSCDKSLAVR